MPRGPRGSSRPRRCAGNASVLPQPKGRSAFFPPVTSAAVIHSDGVREQVFAALAFPIKSQASEEERRTNFPVFGENTFGKTAQELSLRGAPGLSLIPVAITHRRPTPPPARGPLGLAGTFFYSRAFACHIKSIYQAVNNRSLPFFVAPLRSASALPLKRQGSSGNLLPGRCSIRIKVQL